MHDSVYFILQFIQKLSLKDYVDSQKSVKTHKCLVNFTSFKTGIIIISDKNKTICTN